MPNFEKTCHGAWNVEANMRSSLNFFSNFLFPPPFHHQPSMRGGWITHSWLYLNFVECYLMRAPKCCLNFFLLVCYPFRPLLNFPLYYLNLLLIYRDFWLFSTHLLLCLLNYSLFTWKRLSDDDELNHAWNLTPSNCFSEPFFLAVFFLFLVGKAIKTTITAARLLFAFSITFFQIKVGKCCDLMKSFAGSENLFDTRFSTFDFCSAEICSRIFRKIIRFE